MSVPTGFATIDHISSIARPLRQSLTTSIDAREPSAKTIYIELP